MYYFESEAGREAYGIVHRVRRLHDWALFAAKELMAEEERRKLEKEMTALKPLKHQRIIQFVDWYQDKPGNWILVTEFCPHGTLLDFLEKRNTLLGAHEAAEILRQVAEGLVYLHGKGVTHRDLKPENILVRSLKPLALALGDFGLAKPKRSEMQTICGTNPYMAPEIVFDHYTNAVDIWALGITGLQLLGHNIEERVGTLLRTDWHNRLLQEMTKMDARDPRRPFIVNIRKMLAKDPKDRPDAVECLENAKDLLKVLPSSAQLRGPVPSSGSQAPAPASNSRRTTQLSVAPRTRRFGCPRSGHPISSVNSLRARGARRANRRRIRRQPSLRAHISEELVSCRDPTLMDWRHARFPVLGRQMTSLRRRREEVPRRSRGLRAIHPAQRHPRLHLALDNRHRGSHLPCSGGVVGALSDPDLPE